MMSDLSPNLRLWLFLLDSNIFRCVSKSGESVYQRIPGTLPKLSSVDFPSGFWSSKSTCFCFQSKNNLFGTLYCPFKISLALVEAPCMNDWFATALILFMSPLCSPLHHQMHVRINRAMQKTHKLGVVAFNILSSLFLHYLFLKKQCILHHFFAVLPRWKYIM